jgi:hypothetical protein
MTVFECRLCGECCYGEGGISVAEEEVARIAGFLGRPADRFLDLFCETRNGRLCLKTGPDNWCIFFDKEAMCLIHPVKPARCARWPFFEAIVGDEDNLDLAKGACPGIRRDCTHGEFVREAVEAGFPPAERAREEK